jgi:hypothetical protein
MRAIHWIIAVVGLAFVLPAPADAAQTDPEVVIYRFPGVFDDGSVSNFGVATAFHCTNFSGVTETIRLVTRDGNGTLLQNTTFTISHLATRTIVTHSVSGYVSQSNLSIQGFGQGTTAIAATSTNIICTAMTIDAAHPQNGVSLRGIRFNPVPGSQE